MHFSNNSLPVALADKVLELELLLEVALPLLRAQVGAASIRSGDDRGNYGDLRLLVSNIFD